MTRRGGDGAGATKKPAPPVYQWRARVGGLYYLFCSVTGGYDGKAAWGKGLLDRLPNDLEEGAPAVGDDADWKSERDAIPLGRLPRLRGQLIPYEIDKIYHT